jgi:hypothetical protein
MKRLLIYLLLLKNSIALAESKLTVYGFFSNVKDKTSVVIRDYSYEQNQIATSYIKSGKCVFEIIPELPEGVYQLLINYPTSNLNNDETYIFNIIKVKEENTIKFSFNPKLSYLPIILESGINKNWYEYLKTQNFRINVIKEFKKYVLNTTSTKPPMDYDYLIQKEIEEVKEIKQKYISDNYNKWSTYLAKNSTALLEFEDYSKENYWTHFDTENVELINSPILQEAIQYYMIRYYSHGEFENYKRALDEVIYHFSKNSTIKEWAIKHILSGLKKSGSNELFLYFSSKYTT